jgi:hypothetical protein
MIRDSRTMLQAGKVGRRKNPTTTYFINAQFGREENDDLRL